MITASAHSRKSIRYRKEFQAREKEAREMKKQWDERGRREGGLTAEVLNLNKTLANAEKNDQVSQV